MTIRFALWLAGLAATWTPVLAQSDPRLVAVVRQAQEGDADSARATLGRLLQSTPATDTLYPQLLFVAALTAPTAQEMQRSLQRITVEHALTPWADDALLKLAQLEYAGGNLPGAARNLERLRSDFPASPVFGLAAVWAARSYFDMRAQQPACEWLGLGLARVRMSEPDVRDQLRFFAQRCPAAVLARYAAADSAASRISEPDPVPVATDAAPSTPRDTIRLAGRDTTRAVVPDSAAAPAAPIQTIPPVSSTPAFRVQVMAATTQAMADDALRRLRAIGLEGRIVPEGGLLKVRAGSYATAAQARAALPRIRAEFPGAFPVLDR